MTRAMLTPRAPSCRRPRSLWVELRTPGVVTLLLGFAFFACQSDGEDAAQPMGGSQADMDGILDGTVTVRGDGASEFLSSDGSSSYAGSGGGSSGGYAGSGAAGGPPASSEDGSGDAAARAISEADVLQLSGDRLYALSSFKGLTVVDVSNPAALRLEGTYTAAAEPFEMYVQDGIVFAMFNDWSMFACEELTGF